MGGWCIRKWMRTINETFHDAEFEQLKAVKGDRRWREAILEEFGVADV